MAGAFRSTLLLVAASGKTSLGQNGIVVNILLLNFCCLLYWNWFSSGLLAEFPKGGKFFSHLANTGIYLRREHQQNNYSTWRHRLWLFLSCDAKTLPRGRINEITGEHSNQQRFRLSLARTVEQASIVR